MSQSSVSSIGRKLRLGVIGGGIGSFIGPIHRGAATLYEQYVVVASVLSSNPERSKSMGDSLGIPVPTLLLMNCLKLSVIILKKSMY